MCHQVDYGCGYHTHTSIGGWRHHWGCCCSPGHPLRHFPTREEIVEELEEYLKQLRAEAKRVEERIAELRKEG